MSEKSEKEDEATISFSLNCYNIRALFQRSNPNPLIFTKRYHIICDSLLKKIDAFSQISPYFFMLFFQRWKWNGFSQVSPYFFTTLNGTKSKFRQETLNILCALKSTGSHLAFYDWKVSFSLISPIIFFS